MKKITLAATLLLTSSVSAYCAEAKGAKEMNSKAAPAQADAKYNLPPGTYAALDTEKGVIICRLFEKEAPVTVANFIGLATGTKEWTHPRSGKKEKNRFYDGLSFMRVIPGFMIQGGDPLNNCTGGPGYQFEDEFSSGLKFDKPGLLAMANAGPGTNGSQFFITDQGPAPSHLNNKHTIFGEVVQGLDVVSAIARVPAQRGMAIKPVRINKVDIMKIMPKKASK
ncbi:MAG TPA: peptidylprolyl isomerase [Elusimicrobiales bacterium]|nr:peptidylprolyl isomerase [Elusimicrobiales bacterium]